MQSLNNQRILVIGESSGIGLAIAAATADTGAAVTIASRNLEKLTALASKLSGAVHIAVTPQTALEVGATLWKRRMMAWRGLKKQSRFHRRSCLLTFECHEWMVSFA